VTDIQIIKNAVARLKNDKVGTQKEIGRMLGYTNESSFSQVLNEKVPLPPDLIGKIMGLNEDIKKFILDIKLDTSLQPKNEAKLIRRADPYGLEANEEKIYQLPDDSLVMQVPVIPFRAWGSYLRGHADPEYYEGLETIPVPVDHKHKGNYLIFEVGGESMKNPGDRRSIWPGEKLVGRNLKREHWKYKLHISSVPCWIIVHRELGIVVKEITNHNIDKAELTLHSWNPDKDEYPDYIVSLNDVEQIFNVVDPFNKFG